MVVQDEAIRNTFQKQLEQLTVNKDNETKDTNMASTLTPYAAVHASPAGPGDKRPTAAQVLADQKLSPASLTHLTSLVTGCTSGIGFETARALQATGMRVFITARTLEKGASAAQQIQAANAKAHPGQTLQDIQVIQLALDDLSSVRRAAADANARIGAQGLNILVCNAGVMACPQGTTADGFETQFGTNHLGHFLLLQNLLPALTRGANAAGQSAAPFASRVVAVSSSGHRIAGVHAPDYHFAQGGYNPWLAYGQSKTANIYMTNALERHYGARGIHGLALHPGMILDTSLTRHMTPDDFQSFGIEQSEMETHTKSVEQGAATTVWACVAAQLEGKGGLMLGDVGVDGPVKEGAGPSHVGWAEWAFDEAKEEQLWTDSLRMVGLASA